MRLKNTPMSADEENKLLNAFPPMLSAEEEEQARRFFEPLLFYSPHPDGSKDCSCSVCGENFAVQRKGNQAFFRISHKSKEKVPCPECNKNVRLVAMRKYETFRSLNSREPAARLLTCGTDLLLESGYLYRSFHKDFKSGQWYYGGEDYVTMDIQWVPIRRYVFRPGVVHEWKRGDLTDHGNPYSNGCPVSWKSPVSIGAAIPGMLGNQYQPGVTYWVMNPGKLLESSLRYCQYFKWFANKFGAWIGSDIVDPENMDAESMAYIEPIKFAYLAFYCACYAKYPQIEMAVKLGYDSIVSDLVICRRLNAKRLDWRAKNPADFLRLSKSDFRVFMDKSGNPQDLDDFRNLLNAGLVKDFFQFWDVRAAVGNVNSFADLVYCCKKLKDFGCTLERGNLYIKSLKQREFQRRPDGTGHTTRYFLQLWRDYIDASITLQYDLSAETVRFPKDLQARHDTAAVSREIEQDKLTLKRYKPIFSKLTAQYGFEADGLSIIVPETGAEIIREGNLLSHCVGGYAARHLNGVCTILFLRHTDAIDTPYVTIEMKPDTNCKYISIRQIHGYKNDRESRESPMNLHGDFLKVWLDWVHAGSPRDNAGKPVLMKENVVFSEEA